MTGRNNRAIVPLGFLCCFLSLPAPALGEELSPKALYRQTLRSTALVLTGRASGTGWIADTEGKLLLTGAHVVGASTSVAVVFPAFEDGKVVAERAHYAKSGRFVRGRVLVTDPRRDLALIKVESLPEGAAALKLAGESVSPGDRVHAVGNPGASGALWVYTSGTVRQVYRRKVKIEEQDVEARVVETQAPLNPGDSGGPVVNDGGELVGVTAAINKSAQLVSLCIDVGEVKEFLAEAPRLLRPQTVADHVKNGAFHYDRKQFDRAIAAYTEAIKLDAAAAVPHRNRGIAFYRKGELQKALADCDRAVRLDPKDPFAYLWRGRILARLGETARAEADFQEAARLDPSLGKK
jgi:S1-C subfamily serine protease